MDNGEIMKIKQRYDKEILEKFPKLKFLNKAGIQPDYEDEDIDKPEVKKRMCSFSQNKAKRIEDTKEAIPHTLDGLDVSLILSIIRFLPFLKIMKVYDIINSV